MIRLVLAIVLRRYRPLRTIANDYDGVDDAIEIDVENVNASVDHAPIHWHEMLLIGPSQIDQSMVLPLMLIGPMVMWPDDDALNPMMVPVAVRKAFGADRMIGTMLN